MDQIVKSIRFLENEKYLVDYVEENSKYFSTYVKELIKKDMESKRSINKTDFTSILLEELKNNEEVQKAIIELLTKNNSNESDTRNKELEEEREDFLRFMNS